MQCCLLCWWGHHDWQYNVVTVNHFVGWSSLISRLITQNLAENSAVNFLDQIWVSLPCNVPKAKYLICTSCWQSRIWTLTDQVASVDQCLTKSEWAPQIRAFYLRQNHEEPWWWTFSLSLSLSNRDLLPNASGSSPLLKSLWNLSLPKSVLCFCMLVMIPLAVEITFSLIELQKVGVQPSLKVVNHITFSFINSLESFVEAGILFPLI